MTTQTQPIRDRSIDILKGFGIILMVLGHIGFGDPFSQFCASFYMPLFYVISGYLLNDKRSAGRFILKKAKTLMIPYYVFGSAGMVLSYFLQHDTFMERLYNFFLFPSATIMSSAGAVWFLMSLFISESIYYLFFKFLKNKHLTAIPCVILCVILTVVPNYFDVLLPFTLNTVGISLVYIHFGFLLRLFAEKNKQKNALTLGPLLIAVLLVAHFVLCFFANGKTNYRLAQFDKSMLLYLFISMIAIIGYWNLSKKLKQPRLLLDYLNFVGKNSIVYLVTNQILIRIYKQLFSSYMYSKELPRMIIATGACIIFVLLAEHALVYVFRLRGLKLLIGK